MKVKLQIIEEKHTIINIEKELQDHQVKPLTEHLQVN